MKNINSLIIGFAFGIVLLAAGTSSAQDDVMKKVEDTTKTVAHKTASGAKAVYKGGKRIGYTVGTKTWDGTKWVASKSWQGGKWIAVKTANGTKWVYHKAVHKTKKVL